MPDRRSAVLLRTGIARFSGAISLAVVIVYALVRSRRFSYCHVLVLTFQCLFNAVQHLSSMAQVLEAVQDIRRWRQDQSINGASCKVLSDATGQFEPQRWKDVQVSARCPTQQLPAPALAAEGGQPAPPVRWWRRRQHGM